MGKQKEAGNPGAMSLFIVTLKYQTDDEIKTLAGALMAEIERRPALANEVAALDDPALAGAGGDSFVDLVAQMMDAQQVYFKATYGTIAKANALKESMALESKVRKAIAEGKARRQAKMEL